MLDFRSRPQRKAAGLMGRKDDSVLYDTSMREEELKNKVAKDWFECFDTTQIIGNIDFCVAVPATDLPLCDAQSLLWAESKRGTGRDDTESLIQLILTIGRGRAGWCSSRAILCDIFRCPSRSRRRTRTLAILPRPAQRQSQRLVLRHTPPFSGVKHRREGQIKDERDIRRRQLQPADIKPSRGDAQPCKAHRAESLRIRLS